MKTTIKILISFIGISVIFWLFEFVVVGEPIVIRTSKIDMQSLKVAVGDTINPLNSLYLSHKDFSVYVAIHKDDKQDLDVGLSGGLYLKCNDYNILKDVEQNFDCIVTGGDMATVRSVIYVVCNDEIVFKSGIVLDENIAGLQNRDLGWARTIDRESLVNAFSKFERCYWPILFI